MGFYERYLFLASSISNQLAIKAESDGINLVSQSNQTSHVSWVVALGCFAEQDLHCCLTKERAKPRFCVASVQESTGSSCGTVMVSLLLLLACLHAQTCKQTTKS